MPTSTILVQQRDGSPGRQLRIALEFAFGGMSDEAFTDDRGQAVVQHSSTGEATVYVDGQDEGKFHAPGKYIVTR